MGAQFSADAEDAQVLVRDKQGRLILHTGKMEEATVCTPMPLDQETGAPIQLHNRRIPAKEQPVQMMFFPSTNYQGQNLHLHTFKDNECDIPANDVVYPEKQAKNKNVNLIKQSRISNSNYFEFNSYPVNRPFYPKFFQENDDKIQMPESARRSSYKQCTLMPYHADLENKKPVGVSHNTIPMKLYTSNDCSNEYVNLLDTPDEFSGKQNVADRSAPIEDDSLTVDYTIVTSYINPAQKTNATHYRLYKDDYPT